MRCLAIKLFSATKPFYFHCEQHTESLYSLSNIGVYKEISSIKWVNDDTSNIPVTNVCRRKPTCVANVLFT